MSRRLVVFILGGVFVIMGMSSRGVGVVAAMTVAAFTSAEFCFFLFEAALFFFVFGVSVEEIAGCYKL